MPVRHLALLIAVAAAFVPAARAADDAESRRAGPAASASMPLDCPKMARHDHGADRGTPMAMPARCAMMPATSGDEPASRPRTRKLGHDHARSHKLM